jgi:hypothetical protein
MEMALTLGSLVSSMLEAAKGPLGAGWKTAQPFAKTQFTNIAQQIVDIQSQLKDGTLTQAQASLLLDMQTSASRAALLTIEGIGLLTAQDAINAALGAIATVVNKAVGFALL